MKDLKGYEDVVDKMTAKLAHACDIIKTKLTQEPPKPVEDFENFYYSSEVEKDENS